MLRSTAKYLALRKQIAGSSLRLPVTLIAGLPYKSAVFLQYIAMNPFKQARKLRKTVDCPEHSQKTEIIPEEKTIRKTIFRSCFNSSGNARRQEPESFPV